MSQASAGPLRVAFETLGCRSNHADTVELQAALADRGAVPCDFDSGADVYVINTCTVTDDADKTALQLIRRAKASNPGARIIVTGCMAEVGAEKIKPLEIADAVIGPGRKQEVVAAVLETSHSQPITEPPRTQGLYQAQGINDALSNSLAGPGKFLGEVRSRSRFHLRIQEGCENSCTFCIIPQSRGKLVSREAKIILQDLEKLKSLGYKEVVITGTHLGGWGEDRGQNLGELIEILAENPIIPRLRLSSLDPNDVTKKIVDTLASSDVFCHHLHICIQAFTDSTLKRMNRRYRMKVVRDLLEYIAERWPRCAVGADLITGFPGERRQDVDQGVETFLALPISYLHVFPYSERSGTAAAEFGETRLGGMIEMGERRRRAARFRALANRKRLDYYSSLLGKELEIIVEAARGKSLSEGQPSDLNPPQTIRGTSREFADVRLEGLSPFSPQSLEPPAVHTENMHTENVHIERVQNVTATQAPSGAGGQCLLAPGSLLRVIAVEVDETEGEIVCKLSGREKSDFV